MKKDRNSPEGCWTRFSLPAAAGSAAAGVRLRANVVEVAMAASSRRRVVPGITAVALLHLLPGRIEQAESPLRPTVPVVAEQEVELSACPAKLVQNPKLTPSPQLGWSRSRVPGLNRGASGIVNSTGK
jgi:hypothetical protein